MITLYHRSNVKVRKPEILVSDFYKDSYVLRRIIAYEKRVLYTENPLAVAAEGIPMSYTGFLM